MITFHGDTKTLAAWAKQLGYTDRGSLLSWRIKTWGIERAFSEPLPSHTLTHNGQTKTYKEWADSVGFCDAHGLRKRIDYMGVERALTTPRRIYERHGLSRTPEYRIWNAMITRCTNPKHPQWADYGGRGIRVHDSWLHSFETFINDVGRRPDATMTLDRIDNDGNYEPSNVRWATRKQNSRNRRNNRLLVYNGQQQTMSEWATEYGMSFSTLHHRIERGMSIEDALTKPHTKKTYQ